MSSFKGFEVHWEAYTIVLENLRVFYLKTPEKKWVFGMIRICFNGRAWQYHGPCGRMTIIKVIR